MEAQTWLQYFEPIDAMTASSGTSRPTTPFAAPQDSLRTTPGTPGPFSRQDPPQPSNPEPEPESSTTVNGKRKLRSSRTIEGSRKRSKPTPSGAGASGKDYTPPSARLADLGGVEGCIEKMLELVAMPLCHPEVYLHTGVQPPRGALLPGPPGCGKTLLAYAMAGELGVPFISISAPSIVSGMSGESEKTLFEEEKILHWPTNLLRRHLLLRSLTSPLSLKPS